MCRTIQCMTQQGTTEPMIIHQVRADEVHFLPKYFNGLSPGKKRGHLYGRQRR